MFTSNYHTHTKRCGHADGEDEDYVLEALGHGIVNEVKGVNRVMYDFTSKPPSTIELE